MVTSPETAAAPVTGQVTPAGAAAPGAIPDQQAAPPESPVPAPRVNPT